MAGDSTFKRHDKGRILKNGGRDDRQDMMKTLLGTYLALT